MERGCHCGLQLLPAVPLIQEGQALRGHVTSCLESSRSSWTSLGSFLRCRGSGRAADVRAELITGPTASPPRSLQNQRSRYSPDSLSQLGKQEAAVDNPGLGGTW